jgi:hypothetical protein
MGKFLLYAALLFALSTPCRAQISTTPPSIPSTPSTERAIATATAFMNALIRDSSVDSLINLCALPFCHDDSIVLTTRAGLRTALTELVAATAKGRARTHPHVDSAYVMDIRKEVLFDMVPINIYFTVVNLKMSFQGKDATRILILAVQITDEARVVGIEQ